MVNQRHIARNVSYAHAASSKGGKALIRVIENATGRISLIRRAMGYDREVAKGRDFWEVMVERYRLSLNVVDGSLGNIPTNGPLIVVSNHPYGVLDGLMMGHILRQTRGDFRILAMDVFRNAPDLEGVVLPISFGENKEAVKLNIDTRKEALDYLGAGGAIGIFPGGTVSTSLTPFSHPLDPGWRAFTARLIAKSGATVVPIFFDGRNSRLFQIASHTHDYLRKGLLLKEFRRRVGSKVDIVVGEPFDPEQLKAYAKDGKAMMDFLRRSTYELSPKPVDSTSYGFEFDKWYRA